MKAWIRRYLGHDELTARLVRIGEEEYGIGKRLESLNKEIVTVTTALGRIIAKLEPLLGVPEDDPTRKAASDKLGGEVIAKLKAEQAVLDKYHHTLKGASDEV